MMKMEKKYSAYLAATAFTLRVHFVVTMWLDSSILPFVVDVVIVQAVLLLVVRRTLPDGPAVLRPIIVLPMSPRGLFPLCNNAVNAALVVVGLFCVTAHYTDI